MLIDHAKQAQDSVRRRRRLTNMRPFEVAFVPAGANGWEFLVCKEDSMQVTLEGVAKAQAELQKALEALQKGDSTLPAELLKSLSSSLLPLLGQDGAPVNLVQELKALHADVNTVTQACADVAVIDALDGISTRAAAILKMAEAGANVSTSEPKLEASATSVAKADQVADPVAPVVAPAAEPVAVTEPMTEPEPIDMVEQAGTEGDTADLTLADGEVVTAEEIEKAVPAEGKPGGHKSPPKGYPKDKSQYADPNNFKYPLDTEAHVRAALAYFSKPKNRAGYSPAEVKAIWGRIVGAAKKLGIDVKSPAGPAKAEKACGGDKKEEKTEKTAEAVVAPGAAPEPPKQEQAVVPVTPEVDLMKTLTQSLNELLAPVFKQIGDLKADFEARFVQVAKGDAAVATVPKPAEPGTTPEAPAAKPQDAPTQKPPVVWADDFNENRPVPDDVRCD